MSPADPYGRTDKINEAPCKVLANNLVVLIHEMYELGFPPVFEAGATGASESAVARRI